MNRTWAVSVLAALVPFSIMAADGTVQTGHTAKQLHTETAMKIPVEKTAVVPVDLDKASQQKDVVLPTQPIHVAADSMMMRGKDGYVQGRGNVDLRQGMDEIHAHYIEGNTKTQVYHTAGDYVYLTGDNAFTGTDMTYSSTTGGATLRSVEGFVGPNYYIRGTDAEMLDGTYYLKHGLITTPHAVAKTPDYYLTGDDIRVYPGNKFTAENTKLWFKHICLFTYGYYEGRLDDAQKTKSWLFTLFPRPTYTKADGFGLHGYADFPMNDSGDLHLDVEYILTSKHGLKPSVRLAKDTKIGTFRFGYSKEESTDNDNNIWATKWPELEYVAPRLHLGTTGIYVDSSANWGRWSEDGVGTGTHKGYRTEITHVPLPLWKQANIRFFAGYRRDWYSIQDTERRDPYSGVIVNQGINDHMWASIWYKKHNVSGYTPYRFDTLDDPRQKGLSLGYVLTPRDTFIFTLAQNLDTRDISDRNYTWVRDLHSFIAVITYKQVDKSWEVKLRAKDFD